MQSGLGVVVVVVVVVEFGVVVVEPSREMVAGDESIHA